MKKIVSIIVCICLLVPSMGIAFAQSSNTHENKTLNLSLTTDKNEVDLMKKINRTENEDYCEENSNLQLDIQSIKEKGNMVEISLKGKVDIKGEEYAFSAKNEKLFLVVKENVTLYDGAIAVVLTNDRTKLDGILDLTISSNCTDAVASLNIMIPDENTRMIYLYGEQFEAQKLLVEDIIERRVNEIGPLDEEGGELGWQEDNDLRSSGKYHHVMNVSNKYLDGTNTRSEMVVMNVSKYDPRIKGEQSGSELIRVFTRSYNVDDHVEDGVMAYPYRVNVTFSCGVSNNNAPFLYIINTNPKNEGSNFLKMFKILSSYIEGTTASVLADVILSFAELLDATVTLSDHLNTGEYTKASFKTLVYDPYDPDGVDSINLPYSTPLGEAHKNTSNGLSFIVDYMETTASDDVQNTGMATCTANVEYRVVLGNETRTITVKTGDATYSHVLYGRDY